MITIFVPHKVFMELQLKYYTNLFYANEDASVKLVLYNLMNKQRKILM